MFEKIFSLFRRKSKGERALVSLFPGWGTAGLFSPWTANRAELVQHFRGWNFVAHSAVCEEFGKLAPQVAFRRDGEEAAKSFRKAMRLHGGQRSRALQSHRGKWLDPWRRSKALAALQQHEELEPAPRDHRLCRLLEKPNNWDVGFTFRYKVEMYAGITGVSYLWKVPSEGQLAGNDKAGPAELWPIPTHWVRPLGGEHRLVGSYEIRPAAGYVATDWGGGWFPGGGGVVTLPPEQVIQITWPSPINFIDGHSPYLAGGEWVDVSESIDKARLSMFKNNAYPGVIIEIDKAVADPDQNEIERFKAEFAAKYTEVRNTGKPIVLAPGVKMAPWQRTAIEMDYSNSAEQMHNWMLALHRVGPSIVGMAEQTTFASMIAARANFYESKMKPRLQFYGEALTWGLAREFDDDLVVYWQDPTLHDPQQRLAEHTAYLAAGVLTPNEVRQQLGLQPFEHGGDDPMVMMGLSPIPLQTGEDEADLPVPAAAASQDEASQKQGGMGAPGQPGANGQEKPNGKPNGKPKKPLGAPHEEADNDRRGLADKLLAGRGGKAVPGHARVVVDCDDTTGRILPEVAAVPQVDKAWREEMSGLAKSLGVFGDKVEASAAAMAESVAGVAGRVDALAEAVAADKQTVVNVEPPVVHVTVPPRGNVRRTPKRDAFGNILWVDEEEGAGGSDQGG